jgi:alpha-L-arabinofuranosidase
MSSIITLERERTIGVIDPKLFGGFLEHMGRAIYEGIFEPRSTLADESGLRQDVLEALGELKPTVIRYPGGNFLSGYHWMDGVGPAEQRPRRRDLAWKSIETNQFGTNEFLGFCSRLGTLPMLGVNMGTGSSEEAAALVEYCNAPGGSYYADLRRLHGFPEPRGVKYWCLGNEMDGPWQIGHLEAADYGRKALETAKMMRWHDPSIELVLCGSSSTGMATYPEWDRITLETCWEQVDYLSLHYYAGNRSGDTGSYLALAAQFEEHLSTLEGLLRFVKAKLRSNHEVHLSWDEWNVWYKDQTMDGQWQEAPHLIEEIYNLEDALVVGQWLNVFLRHCRTLKIACLAQLVNVIAPILTRPSGLLRQSIFYPFQMFSRYARGTALDVSCKSPSYKTNLFGSMPLLDVSASYDEADEGSAVFIVNRSQQEAETVEIQWLDWNPGPAMEGFQLAGNDPKAHNTFENPDAVALRSLGALKVQDRNLQLSLPPLSFTCLAAPRKR